MHTCMTMRRASSIQLRRRLSGHYIAFFGPTRLGLFAFRGEQRKRAQQDEPALLWNTADQANAQRCVPRVKRDVLLLGWMQVAGCRWGLTVRYKGSDSSTVTPQRQLLLCPQRQRYVQLLSIS